MPELTFQGSWEPKAIMEKYLGPLGILSKATSSASGVGSGEGKVVQPEWGVFSKGLSRTFCMWTLSLQHRGRRGGGRDCAHGQCHYVVLFGSDRSTGPLCS